LYFSHVPKFAIEFEYYKKWRKHENKAKNYFRSIGWQIFATFVCHESGRYI